jgi:hypothetical protein
MKRSRSQPTRPTHKTLRRLLTPLVVEAAVAVVILALVRRRQQPKPA